MNDMVSSEGIASIKKMLSGFDREEAKKNYEESEKERMKVVELFPLEQWKNLELERYVELPENSGPIFMRMNEPERTLYTLLNRANKIWSCILK